MIRILRRFLAWPGRGPREGRDPTHSPGGVRAGGSPADGIRARDLLLPEDLAALESLHLLSRRLPGQGSSDAGAGRPGGFGTDFLEFRPYHPGADLRRLDPRVFARTGELRVRTYLDRAEHPVTVILDLSGSMAIGEPSKAETALRLAAALGHIALFGGHPFGVVALAGPDGTARLFHRRSGRQVTWLLLDFLARLDVGGRVDLRGAVAAALEPPRHDGRVFLVSDLLDAGAVEALDLLPSVRREAEVLMVHAPQEEALPLRRVEEAGGEFLEAADPEAPGGSLSAGKTVALTPAVAAAYRSRFLEHQERVARACRERGIRFHRVPSDARVVEAVRTVLGGGPA